MEHIAVHSDLDTFLKESCCPGADSLLQRYGPEAPGVSVTTTGRMVRLVLAVSGNPSISYILIMIS